MEQHAWCFDKIQFEWIVAGGVILLMSTIFAIGFGGRSILLFFLPAKSFDKTLKYLSIFSTLCFQLACCSLLILYIECSLCDHNYLIAREATVVLYCMGMLLLYFAIVLRVLGSFKNSVYEMPTNFKLGLMAIGGLQILLLSIMFTFVVLGNAAANMCAAIFFTIHIIMCIALLVILVKKLKAVAKDTDDVFNQRLSSVPVQVQPTKHDKNVSYNVGGKGTIATANMHQYPKCIQSTSLSKPNGNIDSSISKSTNTAVQSKQQNHNCNNHNSFQSATTANSDNQKHLQSTLMDCNSTTVHTSNSNLAVDSQHNGKEESSVSSIRIVNDHDESNRQPTAACTRTPTDVAVHVASAFEDKNGTRGGIGTGSDREDGGRMNSSIYAHPNVNIDIGYNKNVDYKTQKDAKASRSLSMSSSPRHCNMNTDFPQSPSMSRLKRKSQSNNVYQRMVNPLARLTVIVLWATVTTLLATISFVVRSTSFNQYTVFISIFCMIIDQNTNIICLLFQNAFARDDFEKLCKKCDLMVKSLCYNTK